MQQHEENSPGPGRVNSWLQPAGRVAARRKNSARPRARPRTPDARGEVEFAACWPSRANIPSKTFVLRGQDAPGRTDAVALRAHTGVAERYERFELPAL